MDIVEVVVVLIVVVVVQVVCNVRHHAETEQNFNKQNLNYTEILPREKISV